MVLPKKSIQSAKAYINGRHSRRVFDEGAKIIKLDSNEATISPSPRVMGVLTSFLQKGGLNWYPDVDSSELISKLSNYTALPVDCIQTFNGSDNALETICRTYIDPGDEVVLCMPTYDHFRLYAEAADAKLVPVFGPCPFTPKMDRILEAVNENCKIVYIVNPNNPTGMLYSLEEIETLLQTAPHALVLVDEAYFEFCGITAASLVTRYPNLIVTRSFSKAFGLAGLRCGYVLTQPQNLSFINKVRVGKNIHMLAQVAASASLDDLEYMERYVAEVQMARSWLVRKFKGLGLRVIETPANYLLVEVAAPQKVHAFLESRLVFIRDRSTLPQMEGFIRITIGHLLLMERFWKLFNTIPREWLSVQDAPQLQAKVL